LPWQTEVRALPLDTTYDVFISYSRRDRQQAVDLETALAQRSFSNGQPVKVFRDERNLAVGEHVDVALPEAHNASAVVIVLWSDNAAKSRWVYNEAIGAIFGLKYYPLMLDCFESKGLPESVRPFNAGRLSAALADADALIAEIERRKKARLPSKLQVAIHNSMPTSGMGDILIGRDVELAMLHQAWGEGQTNMVVLDAMGGTGKSALINRFLADLANQSWGGAERVYAWSFYSQGTDDKRQGDADGFFDAALAWFGYTGAPVKGAERGRRLAKLIREKRTLLVLDGLEPLQYPTGRAGLGGKLKDDGLEALIKALADQMHGLAVITTRLRIPELNPRTEPAVIRRELHQLTVDAGVTLLKTLGVKAGDEQFRAMVELLRGHALSLNLLATYCNTVTGHLLPSEQEIRQALLDPDLGEQTYVMMRRYEILLEERAREVERPADDTAAGRQLALMYIVGLFDRPAEKAALDVLFAHPIEGLTDALEDLGPRQWAFAVKALREQKLLLPESKPGEIDAHPLIREYFGRRLKETRPEPYRVANARLYEHYKLRDIPEAFHDPVRYGLLALAAEQGPEAFQEWLEARIADRFPAEMLHALPPILRHIAPEHLQDALNNLDEESFNTAITAAQPASVKAMEPLFTAIAHGCAAGLQDASFVEVYLPRVARGAPEWFIWRTLGAFGADLSALAHFFEQPFARPSTNLGEDDQSLVLAQAAFGLRALGRLAEAVEPMSAAHEFAVLAEHWGGATATAGNLSELQLTIGNIGGAVAAGAQAVRHADAMTDKGTTAENLRLVSRTNLADALHRAGDLDEAVLLFEDAERRQVEQKDFPLLYSYRGYLYCDLLLSAAGKATEVRRRAAQTVEFQQNPLGIALDTLSLGRASLVLGDAAEAAVRLDEAVIALEDSGNTDDVPRSLLARATLHRTLGNWHLANADLNATDEIADRCGMKPFRIDSAIERARLTLARDGAPGADTAKRLIAKAKDLIEQTRGRDHEGKERWYAKPTPDIALVEARMAVLSGQPAAARRHLAEAQGWIDRGWKAYVREHAELASLLDGKPGPAAPTGGTPDAKPKRWWHLFG
jgi:hypothetical protein